MSKRRREAMERASESGLGTDVSNINDQMPGEKKNWWRSLSGTRRWIAAGLLCFFTIGIFGAGLKYLEESAREEISKQKQDPQAAKDQSLLARVNPFMPPPTPEPTPQFSKAYIYAGSRLLAVEDAAASAIPPADLAVWRPSNGNWYCLGGPGSQPFTTTWGINGDTPVQGDYDGDGKTDLAIWRVAGGNGTWWILRSSDSTYYTVSQGITDDKPAPADYDGDGKTDVAVFRASLTPNNQRWLITYSSNNSSANIQFGTTYDLAAPADFDGDGKVDIAIWRNSSTTYYALKTTDGGWAIQSLGTSGDEPVPADYDGDGLADFAVRHIDDWIIKQSSNNQTSTISWHTGAVSVPNDYDADGKVDIAVWRPKNGNWYIRQSSYIGQSNELRQVAWGATGDTPVPAYYRR